MSTSGEDTIVALATPAGESAIALLRASGPLCQKILQEQLIDRPINPRRATLTGYRNVRGVVVDEVVCTFYESGASYTGEEVLEISCHGNPLIVQLIYEDLLARGCRAAEPGEFTRSAFLNGRIDLSQAEAVMDLIRARSEKDLEVARRQLNGEVGCAINILVDKLLCIIADIEAYIDFPEEDLPDEDSQGPIRSLSRLGGDFDRLIATSHYRELLHDGVRTVITGAPNAGKSSLLNRLLGEERVLVSSEPGTTRDFVEERVMMGPFLIRLVDTAGLHEAGSELERRSMAKTLEQLRAAELVLLVVDTTVAAPTLPVEAAGVLDTTQVLVVENKVDREDSVAMQRFRGTDAHFRVSAVAGGGVPALRDGIRRSLENGVAVPHEEQIVVGVRHARALEDAKSHINNALGLLREACSEELAASELQGALESMGRITGRVDNEMMLDRLFEQFCIGK